MRNLAAVSIIEMTDVITFWARWVFRTVNIKQIPQDRHAVCTLFCQLQKFDSDQRRNLLLLVRNSLPFIIRS